MEGSINHIEIIYTIRPKCNMQRIPLLEYACPPMIKNSLLVSKDPLVPLTKPPKQTIQLHLPLNTMKAFRHLNMES